ncbi:MAG TPA: hypothetical protein VFO89_03455 [Thermoanaerobaculia bacterium]|nr:hypothetical protein [Thermoanaerobaculia bacterium]
MTEEPSAAIRLQVLAKGGRLGFPLPDALVALLYAVMAVIAFLPPERAARVPAWLAASGEGLMFGLIVEGGFLLMQGTLVDIATRLKKRPPLWAIPFIVGGVVLFSEGAGDVVRIAWQQGAAAFVPLVVSLAQRATLLWTAPGQSDLRRIAIRALAANRITTALVLGAILTAILIVQAVLSDDTPRIVSHAAVPMITGAIYFGIAAIDDWRVRGRAFAGNPTVLFRFDPLDIRLLT